MAWPPAIVCRRIALVIFGLSLMLYTAVSGLLFFFGLDARMTVVVAQFSLLFGLSLLLALLLRIPVREAFALRPAARIHWQMVLAAAVPLQIAGGSMQFAILRLLPEDSPLRRLMEEVVGQFVAVDGVFDLLMLFLAAVVTAAICEEFLFRGLLLHLMRRRAGWHSAIVWSSVMFALYHLNPVVVLPITLVGAYLAVLVWRSGSLYPSILAHGLNNGLALFGLPYFIDEAAYGSYVGIIFVASTTVLGMMLYVYLKATEAPDAGPDVGPAAGKDPAADPGKDPGDAAVPAQPLPGSARASATRGPGRLEGDGVDGGLRHRE